MRRWLVLTSVFAFVAALSAPAPAEITHDVTSQDAFGFNEIGTVVETQGVNRTFVDGWNLFANTVEGARILGRLDGTREFEITFEVRPAEQVRRGGKIWARSTIHRDDPNEDGQTRVTIVIIDTEQSPENLADTLYHELRHVELWLDGDFRASSTGEGGHNDLHDGTGAGISRFHDELEGVEPEPVTLPIPSTPIYDSLADRFADDPTVVDLAMDIGAVIDLDLGATPTFVAVPVDLEEYILDAQIDVETQALIDAYEAAIEAEDGCSTSGDATICGAGPAPPPGPDDVFVGIKISDLLDPATIGSLSIFAGFDSDGDAANNLPAQSLDDPYQGLDRWYEMILEDGIWDFNVWQVSPDGPQLDLGSGAIGAFERDSAWFRIPGDELISDDPRVRVALVGFDGNPLTGITSVDVSGELPSDPLIGLDGSRIGGPATGSATVDGGSLVSYGPTAVPTGGVLDTEFCLFDADGMPRVDLDVFTTLGEPPSSETATHNSGTTDAAGCVRMPLDVGEAAGESSLYFSTGGEATRVGPVAVRDVGGTGAPDDEVDDEDPGAINTIILFVQIFEDVVLERGSGSVNDYEDESGDLTNPFYGADVDLLDTSLPLDWDIEAGQAFTVDSVDAPSFGDNLVRIEPATGETVEPSGYTFYGRYSMAAGVDEREPLSTHWCSLSVHARMPDRPVTIPASVIDDQDPTANTNVWWSAWFGPQGEMFTTKTEVNPETRVAQQVDDHSTLAVVDGNEVTLMIPGAEIDDTDRLVMSGSCSPLEFTDYGLHTRDVLVDIDLPPTYFDPAWVYEGLEEPLVETSVREAVVDTLAPRQDPVSPPQPDVVRHDPSVRAFGETSEGDDGPSTALSLVFMALGLGAVGAGVWAFRQAGDSS